MITKKRSCKKESVSLKTTFLSFQFVAKILKISLKRAEACAAERLKPRTLDPDVRGLSLARCLVSLDKDVYSTSPRCIKWVPYCWGGGGAFRGK